MRIKTQTCPACGHEMHYDPVYEIWVCEDCRCTQTRDWRVRCDT